MPELPSGQTIPSIALGTWQLPDREVGRAVQVALGCGYRHIDGAWIYRNEAAIGKAIMEMGIPRQDLFLTSKLWNGFHRKEHVEMHLDSTLLVLRVAYLDLWLMHWPVAFCADSQGRPSASSRDRNGHLNIDLALTADFLSTWREMERMVDIGKVKNIGVSNFSIGRLEQLLEGARILPAVNQVEVSYLFPQHRLVDWCKNHGILVEAFSPLGSSSNVTKLLKNKTIVAVAKANDITPSQVALSWLVQRGLVVLPRSSDPSRIVLNLQTIELPQKHFDRLQRDSLKREREGKTERIFNPGKSWGIPAIFQDLTAEGELV